jgi:protein kinase-like protein/conflict system STAND superfamily ATPase
MGHVYLALDRVLVRLVAVKFIAALEPNVEARQRFLIEARAAARVQHPNVVTIYRVGEIDGRPYLITEFARGRTLDRLARPVSTAAALQIGIDLARGLAAAHRKGVLHCDIKSANAILTDEGSAKLLDFGLATLVKVVPAPEVGGAAESASREDPTITPLEVARGNRGCIVGTPDTMAPEIWDGCAPTRRSDVYSLGVVLYELCSGVTPFHRVVPRELARVVRGCDAPSLISRAPGVDSRLAEIVDRCLRRAPAERFASGDELRQALEQIARSVAGGPVPEGNPYRGLRAFDVQHRALFFGRSAEIGVLIDRLRTETFLVVAGDSGVGKSSICRAGLLPIVAEGGLGGGRLWSTCTLIPGKHPRAALASTLAAGWREDRVGKASPPRRLGGRVDLPLGWSPSDGRRDFGARRGRGRCRAPRAGGGGAAESAGEESGVRGGVNSNGSCRARRTVSRRARERDSTAQPRRRCRGVRGRPNHDVRGSYWMAGHRDPLGELGLRIQHECAPCGPHRQAMLGGASMTFQLTSPGGNQHRPGNSASNQCIAVNG